MNKHARSLLILWLLGIAITLTGCGRELQQRQAFITFLQKDVIPRNSVILIPTKAMRKKFGEYASHYDVIIDFNMAMLEKIKQPLDKLQREYSEAMKPEATVKARTVATKKYRESLQEIEKTLDEELENAEGRINQFVQPSELKSVYTQAFDKHVRLPANALKALIPATRELLDKNLVLFDFVSANKGKIEIRDGMIQVKDRSTLARLDEMRADIAKMEQSIRNQYADFTKQSMGR